MIAILFIALLLALTFCFLAMGIYFIKEVFRCKSPKDDTSCSGR